MGLPRKYLKVMPPKNSMCSYVQIWWYRWILRDVIQQSSTDPRLSPQRSLGSLLPVPVRCYQQQWCGARLSWGTSLATTVRYHGNTGSCNLGGKLYPTHSPNAAVPGVAEWKRIENLTSGYGKTAMLQLPDDQGSGGLKTLKWQQPGTKIDVSYCRKKLQQLWFPFRLLSALRIQLSLK